MKDQQFNNVHYNFEAKTLHKNCRFPCTDGYLFCPLCGALIEDNVNPSSKCKIDLMAISLKNRRLNRQIVFNYYILVIISLIINIIFFVSYRPITHESFSFPFYYTMQLGVLSLLGIDIRTIIFILRPLVITFIINHVFERFYGFYISTIATVKLIALSIIVFSRDYYSLPPVQSLRFSVNHPWICISTRCVLMISYLFYKTSTWFGIQKFSKLDLQIIYDILGTPRSHNIDVEFVHENFFAIRIFFYSLLYFIFFLIICLNIYFLYFTLRVRRLNKIYESEFLQQSENVF